MEIHLRGFLRISLENKEDFEFEYLMKNKGVLEEILLKDDTKLTGF